MRRLQKRLSELIQQQHAVFLGGLVSLALITVALLFSSSHVLARGEGAAAAGIPQWIGQLSQESDASSLQRAQQKLEEAGDAAVDPLIAALRSTNPVLRRNSTEMLGYLVSPRAEQPLIDILLNDSDASVRGEAIMSLGEFGDLKLTEIIQHAAIFDKDVTVRQAAQSSLTVIRQNLAARAGKDARITSAFAIAPTQPQVVYLAEMGDIAVSRDGGKTWHGAGTLPSRAASLAVSAQSPDVVYAGTESLGFFRSTDGGIAWSPSNTGLGLKPGVTLSVTALTGDPQDPDRLFAAAGFWVGTSTRELIPQAVYSSSDGGATWQELPTSSTSKEVTLLWFENNTLYALAGDQVLTIPL